MLQYLEWGTTTASMLTFWLGTQQRMATWPVNIAITSINMSIYYADALYHRLFIGGFSIMMALYGWRQWRLDRGRHGHAKVVHRLTPREQVVLGAALVLGTWGLQAFFQHLGSYRPVLGALCTMLVFVGQWATTHKKLESYLVWSCLNILSAYIQYMKGRYGFMCKYCFFLVGSIYSYWYWRQLYQARRASEGCGKQLRQGIA